MGSNPTLSATSKLLSESHFDNTVELIVPISFQAAARGRPERCSPFTAATIRRASSSTRRIRGGTAPVRSDPGPGNPRFADREASSRVPLLASRIRSRARLGGGRSDRRRKPVVPSIAQAIDHFLADLSAQNLSPESIRKYNNVLVTRLRAWCAKRGFGHLPQLGVEQTREFRRTWSGGLGYAIKNL